MIKQENLFKKLGLILEELNDQYQFLAQNPQQLNELELELFHANANFLADHVQIIKKINRNQVFPETPINEIQINEIQNPEPLILQDTKPENISEREVPINEHLEKESDEETVQPSVIEFDITENNIFKIEEESPAFEFILNEDNETDKFDFEEKHVDELFNRPLSEEEQRILAQKRKLMEDVVEEELDLANTEDEEIGPEPFLVYKTEETTVIAEQSQTQHTGSGLIADNLADKPTLNEVLASKLTANNINSTANTALTDLKQGINLNDKLLFIKDLFNGYNLAYAEAIELANKLPNFEAADAFFKRNYAIKNNWATKQATVDKFYELLNQRFK